MAKLKALGLGKLFQDPDSCKEVTKKCITDLYIERLNYARREKNCIHHSSIVYDLVPPIPGDGFPYLSRINNAQHRFILLRFRLIPLLLGYPQNKYRLADLAPCPCNNYAVQSDLHIVLFCKNYSGKENIFIPNFEAP